MFWLRMMHETTTGGDEEPTNSSRRLFSSPVWEVWVLVFWWSAWSLADAYLLPYTPCPELIGLALCLLALVAAAVKTFWSPIHKSASPTRTT